MATRRKTLLTAVGAAGFAATTLMGLASPAQAQAGKTFVMKLSTATINDTQHEWLRRFTAAVEKDSGGRIKGEIYPASQLGSIPRQIEGVQFGSIQLWIGPPEFLVGVDERYEALSAPGLFTSTDQAVRVISDPLVREAILGLGANKGLIGVGIAPIGPSSIVSRKPVRHLADFKGTKVRVLASPFQLEMIRRMDASPVAMTLADVLPGLQQGAIDARARHHHRVHHLAVPGCGEVHRGERSALPQLHHRDEQKVARCACRPICRRSCATMRKAPPPRSCRS